MRINNRNQFLIKPYLKRNNFKAISQIISTIIPITTLWLIVNQINKSTLPIFTKWVFFLPIIFLLTLLSCRTFSLMHDCGHNSLFEKRGLNNLFGFLLGVLNGFPQKSWSMDHAFHHRNNGNWEVYKGPIDILSNKEYEKLSKKGKIIYKYSRHWLMLFPGGFYYLILKPRLGLIIIVYNLLISILKETLTKLKERKFHELIRIESRITSPFSDYGNNLDELIDLIFNNVAVTFGWILMSKWLGAIFFLSFYSIISTFTAAILICVFFVQHNYETAYASNDANWDIIDGAIYGSSNLNIPDWLNWFLADISFHSVHHLSERIPNYNLKACHQANIDLLQEAKFLKLRDIPNCFKYILWDSENEKLISLREH